MRGQSGKLSAVWATRRHGWQWETYLNSSANFTSQPAWMQKLFGAESAATDVASARSAIGIGPAFGRRGIGKY